MRVEGTVSGRRLRSQHQVKLWVEKSRAGVALSAPCTCRDGHLLTRVFALLDAMLLEALFVLCRRARLFLFGDAF